MIDKGRLKNLLTDLYEKYNPSHLIFVDELAERYKDSPYSAVDMIFFKYNHKNLPHYDPAKATEQYKIELLKAYQQGDRPFQKVDLVTDAQESVMFEAKQVDADQADAHREQQAQVAEEKVVQVVKNIIIETQRAYDESIDYTVTVEGTDEKVILPTNRFLASMAINTRLILKTESGKIMGFMVKDVTYDFFSSDNKVLAMVHLQRE